MSRLDTKVILSLLALVSQQAAGATLTAPAVDRALFRDGEVARTEKHFAQWRLSCDVVARLRLKYCSLRTAVRARDGMIVADVTISTDEAGRPAALLTVPFGTALREGVLLILTSSRSGADMDRVVLHPAICEDRGCQAVWPLTVRDIDALRSARALTLAFRLAAPASPTPTFTLRSPETITSGRADLAGFTDALAASLK